ncbi:MAG: hypothetical protein ACPGLY_05740 [Rubripirellula sp.]
MGSPYLLAHGQGIPVKDATTAALIPGSGSYRVWLRTKDWVAQWKAPGKPERFQLRLDGTPLGTTFGTVGAQCTGKMAGSWTWKQGMFNSRCVTGALGVRLSRRDWQFFNR